jgi:hypothetical protein
MRYHIPNQGYINTLYWQDVSTLRHIDAMGNGIIWLQLGHFELNGGEVTLALVLHPKDQAKNEYRRIGRIQIVQDVYDAKGWETKTITIV